MPEVRRLLEGQRVHEEIKSKLRESEDSTASGGSLDDAIGKTVPRESDRKMMESMNDRIEREKAV